MGIKEYATEEEMDDDFERLMDGMQDRQRLREEIFCAEEKVAELQEELAHAEEELRELLDRIAATGE